MPSISKRTAILVSIIILSSVSALAHVPGFTGDNTSPEKAYHIENTRKSWSIYDSLKGEQARYYELHVDGGQELRLSLFTPKKDDFRPSVVVMSRHISENDTEEPPEWVSVPEGNRYKVIEGNATTEARYEPFAPSSYYHTLEISRPARGTGHYMVAVYDPEKRSGPVGVAIGSQESFTVVEYVTVPISLVREHLWQGQSPLLVFGPAVLVILLGAGYMRRVIKDKELLSYAMGTGGLLLIGGAVTKSVQMLLALSKSGLTSGAIVTLVFIAVPLTIGVWLLRLVGREDIELDPRTRFKLVSAGFAGLITWGGFIIGPVIVALVGLVPVNFVDSLPKSGDN